MNHVLDVLGSRPEDLRQDAETPCLIEPQRSTLPKGKFWMGDWILYILAEENMMRNLSQLEARHAEDFLQRQAGISFGVHAHSLKYGMHLVAFRQFQGGGVRFRRI